MSTSIENAINSFYQEIKAQDSFDNTSEDNLHLMQLNPLIIIEQIRHSYFELRRQLSQATEREMLLNQTQEDLQTQLKLNAELTLVNETLKKKYNELKQSKNELRKEYQEIEETNDYLTTELIQRSSKLKEVQSTNEQLLQDLSQSKYEYNSLQSKLEKSKSIKNMFGNHGTIIGYVEEEEISAVNPLCKSLTSVKSMMKQTKELKWKKKKSNQVRIPMNKQIVHPSIFNKKVVNVNDTYFKETESLMMVKP